jgi:hypothetical protein
MCRRNSPGLASGDLGWVSKGHLISSNNHHESTSPCLLQKRPLRGARRPNAPPSRTLRNVVLTQKALLVATAQRSQPLAPPGQPSGPKTVLTPDLITARTVPPPARTPGPTIGLTAGRPRGLTTDPKTDPTAALITARTSVPRLVPRAGLTPGLTSGRDPAPTAVPITGPGLARTTGPIVELTLGRITVLITGRDPVRITDRTAALTSAPITGITTVGRNAPPGLLHRMSCLRLSKPSR